MMRARGPGLPPETTLPAAPAPSSPLTLEAYLQQLEERLGVDPEEALRVAWYGQTQ